MSKTVLLEWTYTPPNYFEEALDVSGKDYSMVIINGKVEARVDFEVYYANSSMLEELQSNLDYTFLGAKLFTNRAHEISRPNKFHIHPDGRRDVFIELEGVELKIIPGNVDFRHTDKHGNIISDSKQERIDNIKHFIELARDYGPKDKVLEIMLRSYGSAIDNRSNEFVYLYQVRDALHEKFSSKRNVIEALNITKDQWDDLGKLCNDESLWQGRHRGKNIKGTYRDVSESELEKAREIVLTMIKKYTQYLKTQSTQEQVTKQ